MIAELTKHRQEVFDSTAKCLAAAAEANLSKTPVEIPKLAEKHGVNPQALEAWLDFLDGMVQDTQALVTKIQSLGVPDVSDGQAAASTLKGEFSTLQSDIQSLRDQSADLPTTSEAAFAAAFQPILQKFQTDLTAFGQELSKFTGDKLDAAFSKAPECANLSASSSP